MAESKKNIPVLMLRDSQSSEWFPVAGINLPPAKVTSGTDIVLSDNTEYRLDNVTTLTLSYPEGNFECWMRLKFSDQMDAIAVTFPSGTKYIGAAPFFGPGETWEISIKDKIVVAQMVGDG